MADWRRKAGFGVYLHWPFCAAKCPYCDFNSHVAASVDQSRWLRAFEAEIDRAADRITAPPLQTIYFGGGTPSLMQPETVDGILSHLHRRFAWANDVEITLEANPSSVESDRFRGYRSAGVNRVSLGIQSLNDEDLRALGRLHNVDEALSALRIATDTFDRVSFDLIYGRQRQSLAEWRAELTQALQMQVGHLSLYQLTVEPGTAFGRRHDIGKLPGLPDEDLGADMFDLTQDMCDVAGLPAYEISNHARPGLESRHNQIYWNGGDYLGIGPGAHGRETVDGIRYATETDLTPSIWLQSAERDGGCTRRSALDLEGQRKEYLMMGLRTRQGISRAALCDLGGHPDEQIWLELAEQGLIETEDDRTFVTDRGRPLLNAILRELYD